MGRSTFLMVTLLLMAMRTAAYAEQIPVRHVQSPTHRFVVARSEAGKITANVEFSQAVQGDEVTMHLTYRFWDGSINDESTTYRRQGTLRLVGHHVQKGRLFAKPVDFTVEAATGIGALKLPPRHSRRSGTARREFAPIDAQLDDQQ
jgi:hypothetical protein